MNENDTPTVRLATSDGNDIILNISNSQVDGVDAYTCTIGNIDFLEDGDDNGNNMAFDITYGSEFESLSDNLDIKNEIGDLVVQLISKSIEQFIESNESDII